MRFRYLKIPAGIILAAFVILSVERFTRGDLLERLDLNFTRLDLAYLITVLALPLALAITIKRVRNSRFLAEPVLRREQKPDNTGKPTTKVFNNYYHLIKSWDD